MHLTGKMNGQIIQYDKKISVQVEIITIPHDIIVLMNGIVNGYRTLLATIKSEVSSSKTKVCNLIRLSKKTEKVTLFVTLCLLAEVRPYSFIIPPPYLAVNNDNEKETKNEWNIIDEKKNDTDDNDDDAATKRILLFVYMYLRHPFFIYIYSSFTF